LTVTLAVCAASQKVNAVPVVEPGWLVPFLVELVEAQATAPPI